MGTCSLLAEGELVAGELIHSIVCIVCAQLQHIIVCAEKLNRMCHLAGVFAFLPEAVLDSNAG